MSEKGQVQENSTDCGSDCMAYVTGKTEAECENALGYRGRENIRDDIGSDTHWNHFTTLSKLGLTWRKIDADDVVVECCAAEKTAILFLFWDKILWFIPFPYWHWTVLADSNYEKKVVRCYMGNGKIGVFNEDQFRSQFFAGYEIGKTRTKENWFDIFMSKILRLVA